MSFPATGRVVGVDPGSARVGLAITDAGRLVASPLATLARTTKARDAAYFAKLTQTEGVAAFVVGLPLLPSGEEGTQAKRARDFGAWLAEVTGLPVTFHDERYTTFAADDVMIDAGLSRDQRKERRDRMAALLILQAFLACG